MPTSRQAARVAAWQRRRRQPAWGRAVAAESPGPITFPTTGLRSRAWIAPGADLTQSYLSWTWEDISEFVRWDPGVDITDGRRDQSEVVEASVATLTVDNRDNRFSRDNVLGPYYPYLTRLTPIWLQLNPGDGWHDMYFGFVTDWPKRWPGSTANAIVNITCRGVLHRILHSQILPTPLRRSSTASRPIGGWPMEDGIASTRMASAVAGVSSLPLIGTPEPATADVMAGSLPVIDFVGRSTLQCDSFAPVEINASAGYLSVSYIFRAQAVDSKNQGWDPIVIEMASDSTVFGGQLYCSLVARWNGTEFDTIELDWGEGGHFSSTFGSGADPLDGQGHAVTMISRQDGSNIVHEMWFDGVSEGPFSTHSYAGTLGTPIRIRGPRPRDVSWVGFGNTDVTGARLALGHITIHDTEGALTPQTYHSAATGWDGELDIDRIARIGDEIGIEVTVLGSSSNALGVQPRGNAYTVLRDTEKGGQGVLAERGFSLLYQTSGDRYDQPVSFTVDNALDQIAEELEPDDSDTRFRNEWTVERTNGSSATVQARNGISGIELGPTEPVNPAQDSFNLSADGQTDDLAGWLAHRDSLDENCWPNVAVNLAHHPELIPSWLALQFGQRAQVVNLFTTAGVSTIDAIVEGRAQHWNSCEWTGQLNTSPAKVYNVGKVEDLLLGRLDSAGSTLTADVTSGATSFSVTTTDATDLWTQDPAHFPLDVLISGIPVTLASISGATSPQTFNVDVTGNLITKDLRAGDPVHVRTPILLAW